jgi:hypothetical protein
MPVPGGQKGESLGGNDDSRRNTLFKIGGAAVLGMALKYLLAALVYMPAMRKGPSPGTINEWFTLLQNDRLAGLYYLGFADILNMTGMGLVWLASLIFSILLLWTGKVGKIAAWIGIVAFSLLVPSFLFAGYTYGASTGLGAAMAIVTSLAGGMLSLAWYVVVGVWLLRLRPDEN